MLLAEGREAEVFLQHDGTVLKLMRKLSYEPRVRREAAALNTLRDHGHAAPAVLDMVTVENRPGLVIERLEGADLLTLLGRRPLSVLTAGRVMGEVHAAMHDCVAPAELPDLHDELRQRIQEAAPLPGDLRKAALRLLDELPRGDRLCHGDLHLGNVLGSWSAPVVIDWGDASRGDPTADVVRTALLHRIGELPPGASPMNRVLVTVGRRALVARYLATYRRRRPIDQRLFERWEIVRAAARLWEPIPSEHPRLLRLLEQRLDTAPA
jgi:aminoglycoside phosphotransferase (APT) family kinase protein